MHGRPQTRRAACWRRGKRTTKHFWEPVRAQKARPTRSTFERFPLPLALASPHGVRAGRLRSSPRQESHRGEHFHRNKSTPCGIVRSLVCGELICSLDTRCCAVLGCRPAEQNYERLNTQTCFDYMTVLHGAKLGGTQQLALWQSGKPTSTIASWKDQVQRAEVMGWGVLSCFLTDRVRIIAYFVLVHTVFFSLAYLCERLDINILPSPVSILRLVKWGSGCLTSLAACFLLVGKQIAR